MLYFPLIRTYILIRSYFYYCLKILLTAFRPPIDKTVDLSPQRLSCAHLRPAIYNILIQFSLSRCLAKKIIILIPLSGVMQKRCSLRLLVPLKVSLMRSFYRKKLCTQLYTMTKSLDKQFTDEQSGLGHEQTCPCSKQ